MSLKVATWAALPFALAAAAWAVLNVNPLPGDDEMIAHFHAHRGEIEALVDRYRRFGTGDPFLNDKSGVSRVTESGTIWLPNPYSTETGRALDKLARTDGAGYLALNRRSGSLKIEMSDPRYGLRPAIIRTAFAAAVWKDYFFFPEVPKIENGRLCWPADAEGNLTRTDRVFASLTWYPPEWRKGECVFRRIESRWFIRMCWGA